MNFASQISLARWAIGGLFLWGIALIFDALVTKAILGDNFTYRVILAAFGVVSLIAGIISVVSYQLHSRRLNASKSKDFE